MAAKEIAVKKYVVKLSAEERERLDTLIQSGKHPARKLTRARILLKADAAGGRRSMERQPDRCSAGHQPGDRRARSSATGRGRVRRRADPQALASLGQTAHLRRRLGSQTDRPGLFGATKRPRAMDVEPAGRQGRGVEHRRQGQRQHDRADAKKNILKPHLKEQFVIPPEASAAFVAAMEDVLEVYHRPHDPDRPVVCVDETSKQFIAETRVPIPAKPGRPERYDYEYERNGTANLFMMFAPLEGWRHVKVTDRHTAVDYAQVLKDVVGHALSQAPQDRSRAGQSQHPQTGITLRSFPRRGGTPAG